MFTRIGEAVADWAAHLVFDPAVWIGIVLAGALRRAVPASRLRARAPAPRAPRASGAGRAAPGRPPAPAPRRAAGRARPGRGEPAIDDDMAEIEALLRERGIT